MTVHLERHDLDRYLRRDLPPAHVDVVRRHLDACTACWDRWNSHRWAAARHHPLYDQLARFLGPAFRPGHDSSRSLATAWDRADPRNSDDVAAFFRASTDYLYNLVIWEASGHRPRYLDAALPALRAAKVETVLDIGSGIGSDAIALTQLGHTVTTCDYDSPSTRFARHRRRIRRVDPEHLGRQHAADALWILDTRPPRRPNDRARAPPDPSTDRRDGGPAREPRTRPAALPPPPSVRRHGPAVRPVRPVSGHPRTDHDLAAVLTTQANEP